MPLTHKRGTGGRQPGRGTNGRETQREGTKQPGGLNQVRTARPAGDLYMREKRYSRLEGEVLTASSNAATTHDNEGEALARTSKLYIY